MPNQFIYTGILIAQLDLIAKQKVNMVAEQLQPITHFLYNNKIQEKT